MSRNLEKLHSYLCKLNIFIPPDALLLSAIVKISQIAGINKVQVSSTTIDTSDNCTPANIYGITFLESGSGKDKPLRDIDKNLIHAIKEDFYRRASDYRATKAATTEKQAESKYGTKQSAERSKFISNNSARFLPLEMSNATPEGFIASREAFQDARFGSTFIKISEFGDYITSDNKTREEFLSIVSEVFDHGDSGPKILKSEKESIEITNVSSSAIFHTASSGLLSGKGRDKLFIFLNRGVARRSLICYPSPIAIDDKTIEEIYEESKIATNEVKSLQEELKQCFMHMYTSTKNLTDGTLADAIIEKLPSNTYIYSDEANDRIEMYQIENNIEARRILDNTEAAGLKSELTGRHWRALKLSGLIAAFEHPDQKTVEIDDLEKAIEICTNFAKQMARFYKAKPTSESEMLLNHFLENKDKWISTMDLRSMWFVHKDKFTQWFNNSIDPLAEELEDRGYTLESKKKGKSGMQYRASKITKESNGETTVSFSQATSNDPKETHFESKTIDFSNFHTITGQDKAWSCAQFKDGYRKDDNTTGTISMVALDVDDGLPLEEAKQIFADRKIRCLISTTRSHQVQKGEKIACDRYRIVLPLAEAITLTKDEHSNKIKAVAEEFGIPVDPSARNISRLWFGNSKQEYSYIEGDLIDLSVFEYQDVKKFIHANFPEAYKGNYSGIMNSWKKHYQEKHGGRNRALIACQRFFMNDEGFSPEETRKMMLEVNAGFDHPLEMEELEDTVFQSLK